MKRRRDRRERKQVAEHDRLPMPFGRTDLIEGDGLVPVRSAVLADSETVTLDGIVHGQLGGSPWYGSDEALDEWWPRAVEAWREALRARAGV